MHVFAYGFYFACTQPGASHKYYVEETHGFMNGTIQHLDLPQLLINRTFSQNLMAYGAKSAGYVGAKAIFYGSDAFRDVHKDVAQVVVQSLCVDLCKSIGQAYKSVDGFGQVVDGKLDYFSHKLMHGFVGALGGAVHGVDGIAAGAAGGIIGEVLGEHVLNNASMIEKMRSLQAQGIDQETILREHVDVKAFLVKLTAAVGAGLFGLDTQIAYDGADRAIENNCGQFLSALLVVGESLLALKRAAEFGGKVIRVLDKNGKLVQVLYKASEDGQNKAQEQQVSEDQHHKVQGAMVAQKTLIKNPTETQRTIKVKPIPILLKMRKVTFIKWVKACRVKISLGFQNGLNNR